MDGRRVYVGHSGGSVPVRTVQYGPLTLAACLVVAVEVFP